MKDFLNFLIKRSISYLQEDLNIEVIDSVFEIICPKKMKMKKNTVMIGLGGNINSLISIGSDDLLLDKILESFLEGAPIDNKDIADIRDSLSCEIANIIIGNAISPFANDSIINITPPILIYEESSFFKYKDSKITSVTIKTKFGEMLVVVTMPKIDKFSKQLK